MNTKALRQKVLDLAIHGKLVPQDPNDESATVLLEKIRAEKAEKIKKGELKADKKDSFIFVGSDKRHYEQFTDGTVKDIEDEIPFDVPEGWAWERITNIVTYIGDGDWIESKDQSESGIRLIQTGNIGFGKFKDKEGKYHFISEDTFYKLGCNEIFEGDILLSRLPEPVGRACILPRLPERTITAVDCTIIRLNEKLLSKELFVYYTTSNKYLELIKDNCTGTTRLRISRANLEKIFIPIPPIEEQKRILNEIEKIFIQIDLLDYEKNDLQTVITNAKSKILDLAIHGKLVPQDPNDEPAEELLKRISTSDNRPYEKVEEGDIPFEIPLSWKWTTIKNIVNYIGDGDWIESKDQSDKGIRLIQTGNIGFGTFKDKEGKYHYISENTFSSLGCNEIFEGDILISRLPEPVGRACILPKVPERMITAVDCTIIRLNEELFQKELFVYYTISNKYLELIKENCTGTTRLRISRSNLEKILVPIPPLKEQKRILDRIKELFMSLDEIILNLI